MVTVTAAQIELLRRIVRKVDRKVAFQAHHLPDGSIELKLNVGARKAETRIAAEPLEASAEDVMQFETLRRQVKRVYDRMWAPAPPPKAPKVEVQKDIAFGFRPSGNRGGRR